MLLIGHVASVDTICGSFSHVKREKLQGCFSSAVDYHIVISVYYS